MATPDMDVVKEIPGYKVILKAVLKSQIQQLVEQLANHTDEESVILTASVSDGTLSHLGSDSGRFFLSDHEDIKSQFLGFCLKRHHKKKVQEEQQAQAEQRGPTLPQHMVPPNPGPRHRFGTLNRPPGYVRPNSNVRHEPYPIIRPRRSLDSSIDNFKAVTSEKNDYSIKVEPEDASQQSKTGQSQSVGDRNISSDQPNSSLYNSDSSQGAFDSNKDLDPNVNVKVEAISEADMELEITGVELGNNPSGSKNDASMWSPNTSMGQDQLVAGATGMPGDVQAQASYSDASNEQEQLHRNIHNAQGQGQLFVCKNQHHGKNCGCCIPRKAHGCDKCGKIFPTKWKLDTHYRTHTGEKPFSCRVCGRAFNVKGNLNSHMLVHMS